MQFAPRIYYCEGTHSFTGPHLHRQLLRLDKTINLPLFLLLNLLILVHGYKPNESKNAIYGSNAEHQPRTEVSNGLVHPCVIYIALKELLTACQYRVFPTYIQSILRRP